ncbi:MAG TPA: hypothetical protein EYP19_04355 [Desulfobacterales bacterium]|nr:hypothetical protein [Desulfobacterales bacterium]
MKANTRFFVFGLCALMVLSVGYTTNVLSADEATVIGTVYATAWDDNDNVVAAVIAGGDQDYSIVANAAGKELFKLENEVVKASGVIGKDSEGRNTVSITKYEVMPE